MAFEKIGSKKRHQQKARACGNVTAGAMRGKANMAKPLHGPARSVFGLKPDLNEVLYAIQSLYTDELKPFGRILRKRIAEHAIMTNIESNCTTVTAESFNVLPDVDIVHLRALCNACDLLHVEPEGGGDWSAVFVGHPQKFVDVYSSDDVYPARLWAECASYFTNLNRQEMILPGGRYSCAQALMKRQLSFLAGRSLGQVCHIIQLAISQKKILGYSDGAVVPYSHSQSMVKEQCAIWQQPCANSGGQESVDAGALPLASWDAARKCLRDILDNLEEPRHGAATIPLSNVKRLFRSRYNLELSETALGHSKLSELLQDKRFQGVCTVQLEGHGYIVVRQNEPQPKISNTTISLASILLPRKSAINNTCDSTCGRGTPRRVAFCPDEPLRLDDTGFLTPSPGIPTSGTDDKCPMEPHRLEFCPDEPLSIEDAGLFIEGEPSAPLPLPTPLLSPGVPTSATVRRWSGEPGCAKFCPDEPLNFEGAGLHVECELSAPFLPGTPLLSPGIPTSATISKWSGEPRRLQFCSDEPLCFEDVEGEPLTFLPSQTPFPSPGVPSSATVRKWPTFALSPSTLSKEGRVGSIVQNTFIHATSPSVKPSSNARFRCQSVPKDMGSNRNTWETACHSLGFLPRPLQGSRGSNESTVEGSVSAVGSSGSGHKMPLSPASSSATEHGGDLSAFVPMSTPRTKQHTTHFCLDEPLILEDAWCFEEPCKVPAVKGSPLGWIVQNTFVHIEPAPLTPAPGSLRRASSVPRNLGCCPTDCDGTLH